MPAIRTLFPELDEDTDAVVSAETDRQRRSALGQFLTPPSIADFMASLLDARMQSVEFLDAGAGRGALTQAFVRQACAKAQKPERISVTAYELDSGLIAELRSTFETCRCECESAGIKFQSVIQNEDFLAAIVRQLHADPFGARMIRFNTAIVNPPYRKIHNESQARRLLRSVGVETSNLYTGFLALIVKMLAPDGELVAITPRSFCNGPYFKTFRVEFLRQMSLRRLHVFESRSAAFAEDEVLQENIVYHAVKSRKPPRHVVISTSSGEAGALVFARGVGYEDVVSPDDPEQFIHLETDASHQSARAAMNRLSASLAELGLNVSTGRVVDFRAKEFLRMEPDDNTVPLIYPCHFSGNSVEWPKTGGRKPNAIVNNQQTSNLLVPAGVYVLLKRFTAKEERRRVVASVYDSARIPGPLIGFENHLNYFHAGGSGIDRDLAIGLTAFLNSTIVDDYFRKFSGHTQVNSTDLRSLKYPSRTSLERLGRMLPGTSTAQGDLDCIVERELF